MGLKKPISVSVTEFKEICKMYIQAKGDHRAFAIRVDGEPGTGKSEVIKQVIDENLEHFIGTRVAFKDNPDFVGHLIPDREKKTSVYLKPEDLPEKPNTGWFLDEINRVYHPCILQTLFQMISEGRLGPHVLPSRTFIFLAGNLGDEDDTIVTDFEDRALETRYAWFRLEPNKDEWMDYAKTKIDTTLTSFLEKNSEYWQKLKGRVWFQVDEAIKFEDTFLDKLKKGSVPHRKLLESIATKESINEYIHFCKEFDEIDEQEILKDYTKVKDKIKKIDRERIFQINVKLLNYFENIEKDEKIKLADTKEIVNVLKYSKYLDKDTASEFISKLLSFPKVILQFQEMKTKENFPFTKEEQERMRDMYV